MSTNNANVNTQNGTSTAWQIIGRLITAGVVLAITAFLRLVLELIVFGL